MFTIKKNKDLTFENWVTVDGQPVKVSDLPENWKQALGNRLRREPLKALGYEVEVVSKVS